MLPGDCCPLFKKDDRRQCGNYRGTCLIDIAAKVFVSLLLRRFQATRDIRTYRSQCGFRPGRGGWIIFSICAGLSNTGGASSSQQ